MQHFDSILKLISFKTNNYYRTYIVDKDVLILEKSQHSTSSVDRIRELVSINSVANKYKYSCILLANDNIQIKKNKI